VIAGQTAIKAHRENNFTRFVLRDYRRALNESYVLQDLKLYRRTPHMLHNDRIYTQYPELLCGLMDKIYRIDGTPKQTMTKLLLGEAREKIGLKNLLADVFTGWRAL